MQVKREWIERLIFGDAASRRFTQDSPILPDVWIQFGLAYCRNAQARVDLLLTPHRQAPAGRLCTTVRKRLGAERETGRWQSLHPGDDRPSASIAYNQSSVVAKLFFDELIRVVLPLSSWWTDLVCNRSNNLPDELRSRRRLIAEALRHLSENPEQSPASRKLIEPRVRPSKDSTAETGNADAKENPVALEELPDLLWMIRVAGTILLAGQVTSAPSREEARKRLFFNLSQRYEELVDQFSDLVMGLKAPPEEDQSLLWTVSRNRPVAPSIWRSALSVKADAVRRLFQASCGDLCWAIVDSGIDAEHPAFRLRKDDYPASRPFEERNGKWLNNTRILGTFDFTEIRSLLDPDRSEPTMRKAASITKPDSAVMKRTENLDGMPEPANKPPGKDELDDRAQEFTWRLRHGKAIDWEGLRPFLEVLHDDHYQPPRNEHGTHVAGILAGDWRKKEWQNYPRAEGDLVGICPDLRLYDFRVLGDKPIQDEDSEDGEDRETKRFGDEFSVLAALQFIRHMNAQHEQPVIHGVNLSLSMKHDVANYACGRTPVCEECERVVASGVVVVAAAGNDGYARFTTPEGAPSDGYRSISISDPGNAEGVITVGATHRYQPHTYGVSYFSSRGPTGDGRIKPDLVAPGEKITAPVPGGRARTKDGTSMAAPHVSGAAALLMARHRELLGQPQQVKKILCASATDLGRERYFQGSGMLDILRALQSV